MIDHEALEDMDTESHENLREKIWNHFEARTGNCYDILYYLIPEKPGWTAQCTWQEATLSVLF